MTIDNTKTKLSWRAPDFEYYPKDISWFWWSIAFAVAILAIALWQKNFLFAVFIVVAETMVVAWSNKPPTFFQLTLDEKGVSVGNSFYPYSDIEHFSVLEGSGEFAEIILKNKKRLSQFVTVRIDKNLLPKAKEILLTYLPEQEYEEPLPDSLARVIKF